MQDIHTRKFNECRIYLGSSPNLRLAMQPVETSRDAIADAVIRYPVQSLEGRGWRELVAEALRRLGVPMGPYHVEGLEEAIRDGPARGSTPAK